MKQVGEHPVTTMYEVELLRSDEIMTIAYIVDIENLPVENYHAQISVTPISDTQCEARIRSRFIGVDWGIPGLDAQNIVTDFYTKGPQQNGAGSWKGKGPEFGAYFSLIVGSDGAAGAGCLASHSKAFFPGKKK